MVDDFATESLCVTSSRPLLFPPASQHDLMAASRHGAYTFRPPATPPPSLLFSPSLLFTSPPSLLFFHHHSLDCFHESSHPTCYLLPPYLKVSVSSIYDESNAQEERHSDSRRVVGKQFLAKAELMRKITTEIAHSFFHPPSPSFPCSTIDSALLLGVRAATHTSFG
jgi:hypothetical protein